MQKDMNFTFPAPVEGQLRVCHMPQVGSMAQAFHVPVESPDEAAKIVNVLARYDGFQFAHNIKGDYANTSYLEVFEGGEWCDWVSDDDESFEEWLLGKDESR